MLQAPYALLGLGLIPLIILLRLWRLKPITVIVPSLLLWEKIPQTPPERTAARRINFVLSLIIHVLAVTSLVLALSQPVKAKEHSLPQEITIIFDNSVGMKALTRDGSTRWEKATRHLLELLDRMLPEQPISLFTTVGENRIIKSDVPGIKGSLRSDSGVPTQSGKSIRPLDIPVDWQEFFISVSPLLKGAKDSRPVYLYSDRMPPAEITQPLGAKVHPILFGEPSRNVGITHLSSGQSNTVLVSVKNFSSEAVSLPLGIYAARQLGEKTIRLEPGQTQSVIFEDILNQVQDQVGSPFLVARLLTPDDFPVDNEGWLSLVPHYQIKICWIGGENHRVIKALKTNPSVEIEFCDPTLPGKRRGDLYIYHQVSPDWKTDETRPGKYIVIDPPSSFYPIQLSPKESISQAVTLDNTHSLFKSISGVDFHIWTGRTLGVVPEDKALFRPLVTAGDKVLVGEWSSRLIVLGFDPTWYGTHGDSDWSESISFPIFWTNLLNYLVDKVHPESNYQYARSGEPITLNLRHLKTVKPQKLIISQPDNTTVQIDNPSEDFSLIPYEVGLYKVEADGQTSYLAVNLASTRVSDTTGQTQVPPLSELVPQTGMKTTRQILSLVPYLVGIGLILLVLGWWMEKKS